MNSLAVAAAARKAILTQETAATIAAAETGIDRGMDEGIR
jgi:hypothetical protein